MPQGHTGITWLVIRPNGYIALIMDHLTTYYESGIVFAKSSIRLVRKSTKPDRKEYQKIACATAIGIAVMGFIGFFVKLIHIPINNIIVGGS
uniref:Protein transport protein Sec61 subunit gamma n=1 Tax=Acrobeloides nanus TaxID=290746 RepID=A0A914EHM5_9BILA